jgi:hypothetical protein
MPRAAPLWRSGGSPSLDGPTARAKNEARRGGNRDTPLGGSPDCGRGTTVKTNRSKERSKTQRTTHPHPTAAKTARATAGEVERAKPKTGERMAIDMLHYERELRFEQEKSSPKAAGVARRVSAAAFSAVHAAAKEIYAAQVEALLEQLRPRIERGEFADLTEDTSYVKMGSPEEAFATETTVNDSASVLEVKGYAWVPILPGGFLLERFVSELPILNREVARNYVFATGVIFASSNNREDDDGDVHHIAAQLLANDVRDLFFAKGGSIPATKSANWRCGSDALKLINDYRARLLDARERAERDR